MSTTYNIPFIGGYADGRRITCFQPTDYHQLPEILPLDLTVCSDPFAERALKIHTYKLHWSTSGTPFYAPVDGDPRDAITALLDKYPPPPDPTKIEVPVGLLDAVLRQMDPINPDMTARRRIYKLMMEHYRKHPPQ